MLTLFTDDAPSRDCQGMARREFLKIGGLTLGSLTLGQLLAGRAAAASSGGYVRDKAVVMLFLSGGASHIETFNPNMDAPAPYHSMTGAVQTAIPGVSFGGTFENLARLADRMAVVRSFTHPIGGHVQAIVHILTGGEPNGTSMGSTYARLRGTNHARTGMPTYTLLTEPNEVDPQYRNERGRVQKGSAPGALGQAYAPFDPAGGGTAVANMQLNVPADRLDDRRLLLQQLDRINRGIDATGAIEGFDRFEQQAFEVITGGASDAFNLEKEDARLRERYDTSMFSVGKKLFRPSSLGQRMLLARRLIEAGCGFVTVHTAGWDMHADGNNPGIMKGMEMLGRPVDKAVSAFLEDLEQRGLADKVLLVITGDFGRTPKINKRGGRDHWANLCTLAFAGGGLNMGQVIGRSGRMNDRPNSEPISTGQLMATVMHTLFDPATLRLDPGVPRTIAKVIEQQQPIHELF